MPNLKKRKLTSIMMAAALPMIAGMMIAGSANAAVMDTSLAAPGVYFGTGNANEHFVTNTVSNIELGLGTVKRFVSTVAPDAGTSVYHVSTGVTGVSGKTGTDWGFEFSVNTDLSGTGGLTLANITTSLCVQNIGAGTTSCFDPKTIADNAHSATSPATTLQNAEALQFLNTTSPVDTRYLDLAFDINANNTYIFTLSAYGLDNQLLNSVSMTDIAGTGAAVPEPMTVALFGLGLAGLMMVSRRKYKSGAETL